MKFFTPSFITAVLASTATGASVAPRAKTFTGDMTYYSPDGTFGSCGFKNTSQQRVVSLSALVMKNGPNPNDNPKCGRSVTITYKGATAKGMVVDTCPSCAKGDINVSPRLFQKFAPLTDGRLHDVTWHFT